MHHLTIPPDILSAAATHANNEKSSFVAGRSKPQPRSPSRQFNPLIIAQVSSPSFLSEGTKFGSAKLTNGGNQSKQDGNNELPI